MKELKQISYDTLTEIMESANIDEDAIRRRGYQVYGGGPYVLALDLEADDQAFSFFFQLATILKEREKEENPFPEDHAELAKLPEVARTDGIGRGRIVLFFHGWAPVELPYGEDD
jgi:hypothetical protein